MASGKARDDGSDGADINLMSREEIRTRVAQARLHLRALLRLLPGLIELKKKDRDEDIDLHPKEPDAIRAVLAVADIRPEEFRGTGFAELNEPFNPEEWREAVFLYEQLKPLVEDLAKARTQIRDQVQALAEELTFVGHDAYVTASVLAIDDREIRRLIVPARKVYGPVPYARDLARAKSERTPATADHLKRR